jgi:hypothetical protein
MIDRQQYPMFTRGRFRMRAVTFMLAMAAASTLQCSREPAPPAAQSTAAPPAPVSAISAADRPPAALVQVGDSATGIFDAVYASDWDTAAEQVRSLNEAAQQIPTTLPKPDLVAQLQSRLQYLRQYVSARQRVNAMDTANAVTHLVADLSAEFQTEVPYEAVMLGYYGRQLELGIASGKLATLAQASADLRSTWNRIEPALERRGRIEDVRRFTDIVVQLEGARRPAEFVAPTRAERVEADWIARIFRAPR